MRSVLRGPESDRFLEEAIPALVESTAIRAQNWRPEVRTSYSDIQAAVVFGRDEALLAWARSFDLARTPPRWPLGWAEDKAVSALAWIYDQRKRHLSLEDREDLRGRLKSGLVRLFEAWDAAEYSFFNSTLYNRHGASSIFAGLALFVGDEPRDEEERALFNRCGFVFNEYLKTWRDVMKGGAWPEGWTYWGQGGVTVYHVLAAVDFAFGSRFLREPFSADSLRMVEYLVRPNGAPVPFGDQHTFLLSIGNAGSFVSFEAYKSLALDLGDARALARLRSMGALTETLPNVFPWGAWKIPQTLPMLPPRHLPRMRHFEGAGVVSMRDSWSNGEFESQVHVFCGGSKVSHVQRSDGHFEWFDGGLLAGDAGCYAYGARSEQAVLARGDWGYNTLRIHDVRDVARPLKYVVTGKDANGKDVAEYVRVPLDGGQRRNGSGWSTNRPNTLAELEARAEEFRFGEVLRAEEARGVQHVICDLTACYRNVNEDRPHRVKRYERRFYFIPRIRSLVIADLVHLDRRDSVVVFVVNTREQPIPDSETHSIQLSRHAKVQHEYGVPRGSPFRTADGFLQYRAHGFLHRMQTPLDIRIHGRDQWSVINGQEYIRNQEEAYKTKPEWDPTDETKGPIEACGFRLEMSYAAGASGTLGLVHALSPFASRPVMIDEGPTKTLEFFDGTQRRGALRVTDGEPEWLEA